MLIIFDLMIGLAICRPPLWLTSCFMEVASIRESPNISQPVIQTLGIRGLAPSLDGYWSHMLVCMYGIDVPEEIWSVIWGLEITTYRITKKDLNCNPPEDYRFRAYTVPAAESPETYRSIMGLRDCTVLWLQDDGSTRVFLETRYCKPQQH